MPYSQLPKINQNEAILTIDWNENINVTENQKRIQSLLEKEKLAKTIFSQVGEQQFLLQQENSKSFSEASVYLATNTINEIENVKDKIQKQLKEDYPNATFSLEEPNIKPPMFRRIETIAKY